MRNWPQRNREFSGMPHLPPMMARLSWSRNTAPDVGWQGFYSIRGRQKKSRARKTGVLACQGRHASGLSEPCLSGWLPKEFGVPPSGGLEPRKRGTPNRTSPFNALGLATNRIGMVRTAEDGCLPGQPGRLSSIPSATFSTSSKLIVMAAMRCRALRTHKIGPALGKCC